MLNKVLLYLSILFFLLIFSYDSYLMYVYAFDVPFWDTWDLMPHGNFSHLFDFYNENMQFFYFIISEIMYKLSSWNLRYFSFVNFTVYSFIIVIYWVILSKAKPQNRVSFFPVFLCALITPMLGYNWLWVLLVQTHTFILFYFLAIYFGFTKDDNKYSVLLFALCLFLSVISMNVPLAIGGSFAYIIKELINSRENSYRVCAQKCVTLIVVLCSLVYALSIFTDVGRFVNVSLKHNVFTLDYIYNLSFYLINSFSIFSLAGILTAEICVYLFVVHFVILCIVFFEQYRIKKLQSLWGIMFGILFCVCGVVAFRGGEVYNYEKAYIRHNETVFMLMPAMFMVLFLSKQKIIRYYGALLVILMCFGVIKDVQSKRFQFFGELFYKNGCVCLNHYWNLKTISDWRCQMNFPIAHNVGMEIGEAKKLSFIETIKQCY